MSLAFSPSDLGERCSCNAYHGFYGGPALTGLQKAKRISDYDCGKIGYQITNAPLWVQF